MKNVRLMLLTVTAMLLLGMGTVNAQEASTVMITTSTYGKKITLEVVDESNNTVIEEFKMTKEKSDRTYLKIEMDKWIKKGYVLSQAYGYGYAELSGGGSMPSVTNRYDIVILIKKE